MRTVTTIEELIRELGGVTKAAEIFGEEVNVVGNWQYRCKMPSNKFLVHQTTLLKYGISAPAEFWFSMPSERGATRSKRRTAA